MESPAIQGESPVREKRLRRDGNLSRAGHVESGLNPGGPPSKAKYSLMTDSGQSTARER